VIEIGDELKFEAHAKVNLGLKILGRREDGFHELITLMHELDLHDTIEIKASERDHLMVTGIAVPVTRDNLLFRALDAIRQRGYEVPPLEIRLEKRIPVGGGLGGGSSDAVGLLTALGRRFGIDEDALDDLAAKLGSDTNFFLRGGTSLCRGRGEKVERLPDRDWYFNLVLPDFSCSTPKVFSQVQLGTHHDVNVGEIGRNWAKGEGYGDNDLLDPCCRAYPGMQAVLASARDVGVELCLSGSGSTCFTCHASPLERDRVTDQLRAGKLLATILPARSYHRESDVRSP